MKGEDNMKKHRILKGSCALALAVLLLIPVLSMPAFADGLGLNTDTKPASQYTIDANEQVYALLDFDDERELENAERGLIVAPDSLVIKTDSGKVAWSQDAYAFLDEDAPDTANPSLWRNTQLNHIYGLFEVNYPIKAVLYSHSHVDHYGGVAALITDEQALNGDVLVIAPEGFEEHAVSENVYAGNAMARRASYQYGTLLEPGVTGALCIGIGMGQSHGTTSYISPNVTITRTGETMVVDGVIMEFQLTPGTEAPAEMNTWFPQKNALWLAENCTGTLHNLYTLRGAEVRDGQAWANFLMETLKLYGKDAEVVFQAHNWPHWDNENIVEYIVNTAAAYKYINDQTLLYLNQGYTSTEIANMIELPAELARNWYTRQYYGTVAHNAKAVYQKYMGWYDANPIHLGELEPSVRAQKFVEYLGDVNEVLRRAKEDFDKGEYQWVAELTNMLVFADPENKDARYLCADALEQLAYQAESGTWRNAYLCAAQELRFGTNKDDATRASNSSGGSLITHMTPEMIMQYLGIFTDSKKIEDLSFTANIVLPEVSYVLVVKNGVILYEEGSLHDEADTTWTTTRQGLFAIAQNDREGVEKLVTQDGDTTLLEQLLAANTAAEKDMYFNIVEP